MQWQQPDYDNKSSFLKIEQPIARRQFSQSSGDISRSKYNFKQGNIQQKKSLPTGKSPNQNTYTIACIDDNKSVLMAINSFLDEPKFSVIMINNPVRALMQITRSKPDLILLDVTMPSLDGYELCSLLRRHPFFKETPIIMVTGNTGFIDRAKAKLVKATDYLTKPFTKVDLLQMLDKHLS